MFDAKLTATEVAAAASMTAHVVASRTGLLDQKGYEAQGAALANVAINEARGQAGAWGRIYRDMLGLESLGRAAFRSTIAAQQKGMQTHVNDTKGEDGKANPVYEGAKRSGMVRLSELNSITKALDAAVVFESDWPFHYAVAHAREALRAAGAGSTKGRKATPWMDKFKAYAEKNIPEGEWAQALELIETMAALKA